MANLQWQAIQSNYQTMARPAQVQIENTVGAIPMNTRVVQQPVQPQVEQPQQPYLSQPMQSIYQNNALQVQDPSSVVPHATAATIANTAINFTKPYKLQYKEGLFQTHAPMIIEEAHKAGLNPNDLLALTYIESKFDPNAQNSSYGGLGQINKKLHGNWADPRYNIQETIKLNKANRDYLSKQGINQWDAGVAYLAHQQGLGGATALLKNPNLTAAEALQKTSQWKGKSVDWIDKNIIKANGGMEGMLARDFTNLWVNKANSYSQQFAQLGQQHGGWHNYSVKFRG